MSACHASIVTRSCRWQGGAAVGGVGGSNGARAATATLDEAWRPLCHTSTSTTRSSSTAWLVSHFFMTSREFQVGSYGVGSPSKVSSVGWRGVGVCVGGELALDLAGLGVFRV